MIPQLMWMYELQGTLGGVLGTAITIAERDNPDPLKKIIVFSLSEELGPGDWNPVQTMAHYFAKANNCVLERIHHPPKQLVFEILIKRRIARESKVNPLK